MTYGLSITMEETDLVNPDLGILTYLYDYLEFLTQQPSLTNGSIKFFSQLQYRIGQLDSSIRCSKTSEREYLIGYFHEYLLLVTVKTVKISVTCAICKLACKKFSLKFRERISMDSTVKYVQILQRTLLELFNNMFDLSSEKLLDNDLEIFLKKSMAHKMVQHLLHDCEDLVTECAGCVQEKTQRECLFFKAACYSVGALCIGRLLFAFYQNFSLDEMLRTGLWVACTGSTAAVLHIPRIELEALLNLMTFHQNQYATMLSMIKPWFKNTIKGTAWNGLNSPILTRAL